MELDKLTAIFSLLQIYSTELSAEASGNDWPTGCFKIHLGPGFADSMLASNFRDCSTFRSCNYHLQDSAHMDNCKHNKLDDKRQCQFRFM